MSNLFSISRAVVFLLLTPVMHLFLGLIVVRSVSQLYCVLTSRKLDSKEEYPPLPVCYLLGLLIQLILCLFLRCLSLSWGTSIVVSFIPLIFVSAAEIAAIFSRRYALSLNLTVWLICHLFLGCSLVSFDGEIKTAWVNNYGDLAYHLGMISSFAFGDNFPPQYHIFPGEYLSYPFLINFWTAQHWQIYPSFGMLPLIFLAQWMIVWTLVYFALNGDRYHLLPWAVLFGGGSYQLIYNFHLLENNHVFAGKEFHNFIDKGFPWTPFISTVLVTQRPILLGMAALLWAVNLFHRFIFRPAQDNSAKDLSLELILGALVLALAVLAHTHFFLVGALYLGGSVVLRCLFVSSEKRAPELRNLLGFVLILTISCLFIPVVAAKGGITSIVPGWMAVQPELKQGWLSRGTELFLLWWRNAPVWTVLIILLAYFSKQWAISATLLVLFIVANFVQTAIWNWDQIKVFMALYLISLSIMSFLNLKRSYYIVICILLIIPGLYETVKVVIFQKDHTVFSRENIGLAQKIRTQTPPAAVIVARADHNSPVVLSGRKLFLGYEGTLHSHGLSYQERKQQVTLIKDITRCTVTGETSKICPEYLHWTERDKEFWQGFDPRNESGFVPLLRSSLFKIVAP